MKEINLSMSALGHKESDFKDFTFWLQENRHSVVKLQLAYNDLKAGDLVLLFTALGEDSKIEELDVSDNALGISGAECVANWIEKNKTLFFLQLENCKIGCASSEGWRVQ
jgi:Ran GTPase-activating protein (RanGAP) involved in mRNA processing and transport